MFKKFGAFFVAFLLAAAAGDAMGQAPPQPPAVAALGGFKTLAVTASSARTALPASSAFNAITVVNSGDKDAFIAQGGSTVVAATSGIKVAAGKHITIFVTGTYLAAICGGADSSSLDIYQANGPVYFGP